MPQVGMRRKILKTALIAFTLVSILWMFITSTRSIASGSGFIGFRGISKKPVPRTLLDDLRNKIISSEWIQIFPNYKKMAATVRTGNAFTMTDAKRTTIKLLNVNNLVVGGTLQAVIFSLNKLNQRKSYGGDFFSVVLRRTSNDTDGVTCTVQDEMDGSYSVSCILPWKGAAIVQAKLIHPSETIYELMKRYSSEKEFLIYQNTTVLNSNNKIEYTACSVGFPTKRASQLCDLSNPTHGEKRTCLRTPSGECPKILLSQKKVVQGSKATRKSDPMYCNTNNYVAPISSSQLHITILKSKQAFFQSYPKRKFPKASLDPMTPSGWLVNGEWTSLITGRIQNFDRMAIKRCFVNKRLYFFGDSTVRHIYNYIIQNLDISDYGLNNSVAWSRGRDGFSKHLNITIQYRSHGPPLNNPGPEDARPYMSDSFDAIREGGEETIVIFTIGYHFHYFDADVYLSRLKIIKQAVLSLLRRLRGAKVFIKGLHYHWKEGYGRSPWLTYKLVTILRHEFQSISGVYYVENWDYTLVRNNQLVHPKSDIFLGTIRILLSSICQSAHPPQRP